MNRELTPALGEAQETTLWTLYHRAADARRHDAVLTDPLAVELVDRLEFPFVERFGRAHPLLAQAQALRARRFDLEIADFLAGLPRRSTTRGWTRSPPRTTC